MSFLMAKIEKWKQFSQFTQQWDVFILNDIQDNFQSLCKFHKIWAQLFKANDVVS